MKKVFLVVFVLFCYQFCFSQVKDFHFKRRIAAVDSASWYSVTLPKELFKSLNNDFSDLRIYEFKEKDTIESPYILNVHQQQVTEEIVHPSVFNLVKKGREQFFTLELPKDVQVNFIDLSFNETNFDGFVSIEGSNDQREWFEIKKNQRIISIVNDHLNFNSTSIHFGVQNFRYLRIKVTADKILTLKESTLKNEIINPSIENKIDLSFATEVDKKTKQTVININLKNDQPIVTLLVETNDKVDFYRPFRLEKISDSTSTPKGWQYFYSTITQGYLTSLDSNRFEFNYSLARKLILVIDDADNIPLSIKSISVFSPKVELMARMTKGEHFLYYGNNHASMPNYDVVNFKNKIPSTPPSLLLDDEEKLLQEETRISSLIQNKIWLWILIGVVITVLGYFTIRMMKEKS